MAQPEPDTRDGRAPAAGLAGSTATGHPKNVPDDPDRHRDQQMLPGRPASSPPARTPVPWHRTAPGRCRRARPGAPPLAQGRARTLSKAWGDSLFGMSSQAAFWCALSTAPLLLALLGMIGYVAHWFGPAR